MASFLLNLKILLMPLLIILNPTLTHLRDRYCILFCYDTFLLPMVPIFITEVRRSIKHLKLSKCDGLDYIPSFIIVHCHPLSIVNI
jgi:hypothetical protein